MARRAPTLLLRVLTIAGLCTGLISAAAGAAEASGDSGAVYLISNAVNDRAKDFLADVLGEWVEFLS